MQLVPRFALVVVALVLGLSAQHASAQSTRMVDESELFVRLWTPSPDGGYVVRVDAVVYGLGSHQDALRLDVKQGSRLLSSTRCAFDAFDADAGHMQCESGGAPLTATGEVTVDLVFMDDTAETTEVIRTLALRVNAYPYWMRTEGRRQVMGARYQIDGSDQLGTAFAYMSHPSLQQTVPDETQRIVFYTSFSGRPQGNSVVLRCTAAGQRLPDIRADFATFADFEVDEWTQPQAEIRHVGWYRARIAAEDLWWGPRLERAESGYDTSQIQFLGDHPGLWSCDLRSEGAVLRTFRFTADTAGRIAPHAEQTGPSAMRLVPGTALIDVRLPTPNPIDVAVDPAAIRRGAQYGRPWADPASVREMLEALPPASGSSAPTGGRAPARPRR